jgi:hypothetical protein
MMEKDLFKDYGALSEFEGLDKMNIGLICRREIAYNGIFQELRRYIQT